MDRTSHDNDQAAVNVLDDRSTVERRWREGESEKNVCLRAKGNRDREGEREKGN